MFSARLTRFPRTAPGTARDRRSRTCRMWRNARLSQTDTRAHCEMGGAGLERAARGLAGGSPVPADIQESVRAEVRLGPFWGRNQEVDPSTETFVSRTRQPGRPHGGRERCSKARSDSAELRQQTSEAARTHSQPLGLLRALGYRPVVCALGNPPVQDLGRRSHSWAARSRTAPATSTRAARVSGLRRRCLGARRSVALVVATAVREHPRCQSGHGQRRADDRRPHLGRQQVVPRARRRRDRHAERLVLLRVPFTRSASAGSRNTDDASAASRFRRTTRASWPVSGRRKVNPSRARPGRPFGPSCAGAGSATGGPRAASAA